MSGATPTLRSVDAPKVDIIAAIRHELERHPYDRAVERDALELALAVLDRPLHGDEHHRARRSLQLMQRIARKLSESVGVYERLRLISDRPYA